MSFPVVIVRTGRSALPEATSGLVAGDIVGRVGGGVECGIRILLVIVGHFLRPSKFCNTRIMISSHKLTILFHGQLLIQQIYLGTNIDTSSGLLVYWMEKQ